MGEINTDTRIRVHGGGQLRGDVRLPELEGVQTRPDPLLDRIGRTVAEHPALAGAAMLGGSIAGMTFGPGGLVAKGLWGIAGAVAGFAGAVTLTALAGKVAGTGDPGSDVFVAGRGPRRPRIADPRTAPERLRVLDWNVHALMGTAADGPRSNDEAVARIAQVVRRERPDVLLLQEVQVDALLGGGNDDLAELARALGATDAVLVPNGTRPNGTQKGQAVLTFGATRLDDARGLAHADPHGSGLVRELVGAAGWARSAGVPLPDVGPGFHPRTTMDAVVTTPAGRAVRLLNLHLSGTGGSATGGTPNSTRSQREQLGPLVATLDAWDGPTIVAGDFNVRSDTRFGTFEARMLGREGMRDTFTDRGIEPDDPERGSFRSSNAPIDRVYVSSEFTTRDVRVLRDDAARGASDHLPIVAALELA